MSTLPIRALCIFIIAVLNFCPDNHDIPAVSESCPDAFSVFRLCFLPFVMPCNFFLIAGEMSWVKELLYIGPLWCVGKVLGGEAQGHPEVRSQALVSLCPGHELHQCICPPHLGGKR